MGGLALEQAADMGDQARAKREQAQRARRLAQGLTMKADRDRLLNYAAELEQQANRLERQPGVERPEASPMKPASQAVPFEQHQHHHHQQQQQQQQEDQAGPGDPTDSKPKS
jgi:hypothetical protein